MEECSLGLAQFTFLCTPELPSTMGWDLPYQLLIKKTQDKLAYRWILMEAFCHLRDFPNDSSLYHIDMNLGKMLAVYLFTWFCWNS